MTEESADAAAEAAGAASEGAAAASADAADSDALDRAPTAPTPTGADAAESRSRLRAALVPWRGPAPDPEAIRIRLYVVTGRHGLVSVPESFCRECHVFARRADEAAAAVDHPVEVQVLSWWTHVLGALRHGGYHPPVMVVGGKRLCQGHDVPTTDDEVAAIEAAIEREAS
jgi:hypothetical protein